MQIFLFMNGSIFHFKGRVLCTLFYANFPCYVWSINSLVLRSVDSGYSIIIVNYMKLRDLISKAIINHEIKGELFIIVRYSAIILAKCCFDRWKENKLTKISGILQQTSCVSSKLKGTNRNKKQLSLTKVPSDDFQNTTTNAFKKVAS